MYRLGYDRNYTGLGPQLIRVRKDNVEKAAKKAEKEKAAEERKKVYAYLFYWFDVREADQAELKYLPRMSHHIHYRPLHKLRFKPVLVTQYRSRTPLSRFG